MENEAKGVEVVVSGKLRGQRAKGMKFCDGYMKKSGYSPKGTQLFPISISMLSAAVNSCSLFPHSLLSSSFFFHLLNLDYVDKATRNVELRSGIIGIKVAIMLPWDPTGKKGPKNPLPDVVKILNPKKEDLITPSAH